MTEATREFPPTSNGGAVALTEFRMPYLADADPIGTGTARSAPRMREHARCDPSMLHGE